MYDVFTIGRIIFYCFLIIGHSNGFAYDTLYTGGSFAVFV